MNISLPWILFLLNDFRIMLIYWNQCLVIVSWRAFNHWLSNNGTCKCFVCMNVSLFFDSYRSISNPFVASIEDSIHFISSMNRPFKSTLNTSLIRIVFRRPPLLHLTFGFSSFYSNFLSLCLRSAIKEALSSQLMHERFLVSDGLWKNSFLIFSMKKHLQQSIPYSPLSLWGPSA